MPVSIRCACGNAFDAPDEFDGKSMACPNCGKLSPVRGNRPVVTSDTKGDWISTRCHCGKKVKAPFSMAGKAGRCPRCGSEVMIPWAQRPKPAEVAKPTPAEAPLPGAELAAQGALPWQDEDEAPAQNHAEMSSTGLLHFSGDSANVSADGLPPSISTDGEMDLPEARKPLRSAKRRSRRQAALTGFRYRFRHWFATASDTRAQWKAVIDQNPLYVSLACVFVLLLSGGIFYLESWMNRRPAPITGVRAAPTYFYDLNTGKLFAGNSSQVPPIDAPSGPQPDGTAAGVQAYVFACGDCSIESNRFIAFLETSTLKAKQIRQTQIRHLAGGDSRSRGPSPEDIAADQGTMVRRLEDTTWLPVTDKHASQIMQVQKFCPDGQTRRYCRPERKQPN